MRRYIWQAEDWPNFVFSAQAILPALDHARRAQAFFLGEAVGLSPQERAARVVDAAAESATDSSAIEGEHLNFDDVRSSVARRLGVNPKDSPRDDHTEGVVAMTLDATRNFHLPLTEARLFEWHSELFPLAIGEAPSIAIAQWRRSTSDPMQVVSGPVGRSRVHFKAPPASAVPTMMNEFLQWFNEERQTQNGLIRAAIAHLWFLTIHPFEDGNGRIGRAIADLAFAQDEETPDRLYSFSRQILKERRAYYEQLERTQSGSLDITAWIIWFLECFRRALDAARDATERARRAAAFWQLHNAAPFNARQRKVLYRILGPFEGELNLRLYMAMTKASRATAQRDLSELVELGVLQQVGAGRATHYVICHPDLSVA